jgi:hypothetical protein
MHQSRLTLVVLFVAAGLIVEPAAAFASYDGPPPSAIESPAMPWPTSNSLCSNTQVNTVGPRLVDSSKLSASAQARLNAGQPLTQSDINQAGDLGSGGIAISFTNGIGVVDYGTNTVAAHERPGDKVQLCLIYVPSESQCPTVANDSRGRVYRVYDYQQRAAYRMQNSEHDCGGA